MYLPTARTSSSASSTIPYHSHPSPTANLAALAAAPLPDSLHPQQQQQHQSSHPPPTPRRTSRRARRAAAAARARQRRPNDLFRRSSQNSIPSSALPTGYVPFEDTHHFTEYDPNQNNHPHNQPYTIDFETLQAANATVDTALNLPSHPHQQPASLRSLPHSTVHSDTNLSAEPPSAPSSKLDSFVPHRPTDPTANVPIALSGLVSAFEQVPVQPGYSYEVPPVPASDSRSGRYAVGGGGVGSRFVFRRRRRESSNAGLDGSGDATNADVSDALAASGSAARDLNWTGVPERGAGPSRTHHHQEEAEYFGTTQHDDHDRSADVGQGEQVLLGFLKNILGPKAHNLAVRLMNKTPITSTSSFSYVIHQATEDSDLDIIRRDLISGRLYQAGVKYVAGAWCNLLLGDRFTPGSSGRQRHELTYRRSSCSCIMCRVHLLELARTQNEARSNGHTSETESNSRSADLLSTMSSSSRTPTHSAMANFVVKCKLPSSQALMAIGGSSSSRELEIGSVVRLNYRASAKLKFTDDVRELFSHLAYTGPISHEEVYRRVTTIGVHYYLYNKGKKERKVYIQGELIRLPVQVGVVKLGTQPMYFDEVGATFCLHRKQIMSIYVGEIVLEGNSLGSFIKTGIRYYIGFGEERGVCPVYPNKTLGKARKLGINELLLHHHMVDDLEVRCL